MATTLEQLTYELTQSAEGFNGQIHYDSKGIATLGSGVALINYNSNEEQKFSRKTTIGKISIEEFLKLVTGQQNVAHLITILDNDVISLNQGNGHISSSSDFEINISQDFFVSHIWGGEVGLYETYLNRAKSILDNENTSIYSSITDAQKAVVFSLTFAGAMGSNMARALSHYVSSNAEESFIGRMSSWYEILYQSNNNTSVSDRPGQQNRRFMEANVFLTNNLGSKPTASTAASSFFVSNYNEAKLAVAFMNCKAEEMLNFYKSGNLGGYTNRNYEIVQNHFSQAISTFLSNQNYNGSYDIDTLFKEWNLFIDLQIDVIGQNRPDGTTSHGNITGSDKKDLIFITADKDDTEVRAGTGDDFVGGSSKKDTVYSGNGNDVIYTFSGNDTVYTTDGTSSDYNQIYLGGGRDTFRGGNGDDFVDGGSGNIDYSHITSNIGAADSTTDVNDIDLGGGQNRYIGGISKDIVSGSGYNTVYLGAGSDEYTGGDGVDIVDGGSANTSYSIDGLLDTNTISLGGGNDRYLGGMGKDVVHGGADDDKIWGYDGLNELHGDAGNDEIYGGKDKDIIHTGSGINEVWAYDGNDDVYTNDGSTASDINTIHLGEGVNTFVGGVGRDYVDSSNTAEQTATIDLGGGRDTYSGGAGKDVVHGGEGSDNIYGGAGSNQLFGEGGNDYITSGSANDTLNGGGGADTLLAGYGNNIINVGKDNFDDIVYVENKKGAVDHVYSTKTNDNVIVYGISNIKYTKKDLIIESSRGNTVIIHDRGENEPDPENPEAPKIWDENGNLWQPDANGLWGPVPMGDPLIGPDFDQEDLKKYVEQDKFDPLVLDLNGNGIEMLQANGNYFFDLNGDNIAEEIDWVAPSDGLLVHDANANGQVDGIDELFGNATVDGYDELATFDSNGDGKVNAEDANFSQIKVWQDLNSNNVSDEGELKTLEELGIEELVLTERAQGNDVFNSTIQKIGHIVKTDGTTADMSDIFFSTNTNENTWTGDPVEISSDVAKMPYIRGMGVLPDLHIAAMLDEGLKSILNEINTLSPQDAAQFLQKTTDLIARWTGADTIAETEMAGLLSKKMVTMLSKISGISTLTNVRLANTAKELQQIYIDFYNSVVQNLLVQTYFSSFDNYTGHFFKDSNVILNTPVEDFAGLMTEVAQIDIENNPLLAYNVFQVINDLQRFHPIDGAVFAEGITNWLAETTLVDMTQGLINNKYKIVSGSVNDLTDNSYIIQGVNGADQIILGDGNNFINSLNGNDYIKVGNGNNQIDGGAGDDTIITGEGNDTIIAGAGNDNISGGSGTNIYKFEAGFGQDVLDNFEGDNSSEATLNKPDTVEFGEGIAPNDVTMSRDYLDLVLTIGTDSLRIVKYFSAAGESSYTVNDIKFADGTIWNYDQVRVMWNAAGDSSKGLILTGNNDSNTLDGSSGGDVIYGKNGNDTINAGDGNDIVTGGLGNDNITLGGGDDHLYYNLGDGFDTISDYGNNDTIFFGQGIAFSDLKFTYVNGDLRILIDNNQNQGLLIKDFFSTNLNYKIEELVFADGSQYHLSDMGLTLTQDNHSETVGDTPFNDIIYGNAGDDIITAGDGDDTIYGGSGNDDINSGNGNDIITGGKGDDAMNGNAGADTYIYNIGDGLDTIYASNADTLTFGEGISKGDLTFRQEGDNLRILINGSETDGIININYYSSDTYQFKEIHFADGSVVDLRDIGFTMNQNNASENIRGTAFADVINANAGDDTIDAGAGNDVINGGLGNDTINANYGNDIITGGLGHDYLDGSWGDDTYIYNLGDGLDTISDGAGAEIIKFGEGISFSDLTFHVQGNHLVINIGNNSDQGIVINNMFGNHDYDIERLEFADGTVKNLSQMGFTFNQNETSEEINTTIYDDVINANGGNDTINSSDGNDVLNGGSGHDVLNAGNGDDILNGGLGNDQLNGGNGDDTYIYNLGDGADRIAESNGNDNITFGGNITFENLSFKMNGNDLKIIINNDETQCINISNYFYNNESKIEELNFSDGSQYYLNDIDFNVEQTDAGEIINTGDWDDTVIAGAGDDTVNTGEGNDTINAGDGNDTINAGNGNDSLSGGRGNDILNGGNGADTYYYNLGDGQDTINETAGVDKIVFGSNITPAQLTYIQEGKNLIIIVDGNENQRIQITNHFNFDGSLMEQLQFADGTLINLRTAGLTLQQTDNAETITGTENADIINANAGDDIVNAGSGNDILNGGRGNDTLNGELGNDVFDGGLGQDILNGGSGHDTYKYNLGDGADVINETDGNDTLVFGAGILPSDITYRQNGNDLLLIVKNDETQQIKIVNFFNSDTYKIESFTFADGTILQANEMGFTLNQTNASETINGTSFADIINANGGNDIINAGDGNNIVNGGSGNDAITTGTSDDVISGGLGNDVLDGGSGSDTYIYNLRDGYDEISDGAGASDRIRFGEGISFSDLTFRAEGNHLRIIIKGDETQGVLIKEILNNAAYAIDFLDFADGSSVKFNSSGLIFDQKDIAETINATNYNDTINAKAGNDTINAKDGDDVLNGGIGEDILNAGLGNDILNGGIGNDILNGEAGDDTYIWNLGDGKDIITDSVGFDTISFGSGVSKDDLSFRAEGNNLFIDVKGDETQGLVISNALSNASNRLENIKFADGSILSLQEIGYTFEQTDLHETINATNYDDIINAKAGNDIINANNGDDIINAGAGNDTVEGGEGNDVITGGKNSDILNGGVGDDSYIYNLGDGYDVITEAGGNDKIIFGEGIAKSNLTFVQDENDLKILVNGNSSESITIKEYFNTNNKYKVERIEFADGTLMDLGAENLDLIHQSDKPETINGTDYNDTLLGFGGNDTLNGGAGHDIMNGGNGNDTLNGGLGNDQLTGGKGNDTLNGEAGDDAYYYNLGDGVDTINENGGNDKIIFGEGITASDIKFSSTGNDLHLMIKDNPSQIIHLVNFFNSNTIYQLETLEFADGSTLSLPYSGLTYHQQDTSETINTLLWNDIIHANGGNDTINSNNGDDTIYAGAGNDTINAGDGNDTLVGGTGNDVLNGGNGSDVYQYNLGDGFDTIYDESGNDRLIFGEGITFADLSFRSEGNHLRVFIKGDENQGFCINEFFNGNGHKIERLQFADGSSKSLQNIGLTFNQSNAGETITATNSNDIIYANGGDDTINANGGSDTIYAGDGNDIVNAGAGNDIIHGGKGNDALNGGDGNDTYYYNLGDGLETITETSGTDKIVFGEGITNSNLTYAREGNNLCINLNSDTSQGIIITNYFASVNNKLETLQFADNSIVDFATAGITLTQSDMSDVITSVSNNNDTVYGNGGVDTISTGLGNDHLYGGSGQDNLDGGAGNDTYHYNLGDGYDTIIDGSGTDKIVFGAEISSSSLIYNRHGNDLTIILNDTDSIKIKNFFNSDSIESLVFADGNIININPETISLTPLMEEDQTLVGTAGDDIMTGGAGDDNIDSLGGNDTVYGGAGNDYINIDNGTKVVYGGLGNDYINGSSGNDAYHYSLGDGFDTLVEYNGSNDKVVFGEGITKENLTFYVDGNALRILIDNDEKQGIFCSNFFQNGNTRIETIVFADGTTMDLTQGLPFSPTNGPDILNGSNGDDNYQGGNGNDTLRGYDGADVLNGGAGNDNIEAGYGNDILTGGTGDDYLYGDYGEDTYIYNLGDGFDTINNHDYSNSGNDKIKFGEGISLSDLSFKVDGTSLKVYLNGDESQGLLLQQHQENGYSRMGKFEFADGTIFDLNTNGFTYNQTDQKDNLSGTNYDDIMYLNAGNDEAHGNDGNDTIYGGSGLDNLWGGNGNDIINGGAGDDYLVGEYGEDTYIYNLGDGFDTINNHEYGNTGNDKIKFGEGIILSDLSFSSDGKDLIISIKNDIQQGMRIINHFEDGYYRLGKIEFADGSILDLETTGLTLNQSDDHEIIYGLNQSDTINAGAGNDNITANNGNDTIDAGAGDDTVNAGYGNDDITGGSGNDILDGGTGADTYHYNLGDGFDTINDYDGDGSQIDKIVFGAGITQEDLTFRNDNGSLLIIVKGDESQGILINQFFNESYYGYYRIEQFEFADGTIINNTINGLTLNQLITDETIRSTEYDDVINANGGNDTINSLGGNDTINAGTGNDTADAGYGNDDITGGLGDDVLNGGYGADTYRYNLGDGYDIVYDYDSDSNNLDKVVFGEGITANDLTFRNENNSLRIIVKGDESQGILINQFFHNDYPQYYRIEQFEFADGTIIDNKNNGFVLDQLNIAESIRSTEYDDVINANGGNDTINSLGGNDTINGGTGDDTVNAGYGNDDITGGKGNDILNGEYGADTYRYNLGDGYDIVYDYDSNSNNLDKIVFGEGITSDDLTFRLEGTSLRIIVKGDESQGMLINRFLDTDYPQYYRIEQFEFADGSIMDNKAIGYKLEQLDISENIRTTEFADIINANGGNDTITSLGGNDIINGGTGDDYIDAGYGNDVITGGAGNDTMLGSRGSDTYHYNLGDGLDIIEDYDTSGEASVDKIVFGEGITLNDLTFSYQDGNLNIIIGDNLAQGITIKGFFNESYSHYYKIEQLQFADGSVHDFTNTGVNLIQSNGSTGIRGTEFADAVIADEGNHTIVTLGGDDVIVSGSGHDYIDAGYGNDDITGGKGDDTLIGSRGSDIYRYNLNDGFDTIEDYDTSGEISVDKIIFGEGISKEDLGFANIQDNLVITIKGDSTQGIRINGYFASNAGYYHIEKLVFADGSEIDMNNYGFVLNQHDGSETIAATNFDDEINAQGGNDTIYAYEGNDTIYGGNGNDRIEAAAGNDILVGGKGDDILIGARGSDMYHYNLGDGFDTIDDYDTSGDGSVDKIIFGEGITFADLSFTSKDSGLDIYIKGDTTQGIHINSIFSNGYYNIEKIEFADGSVVELDKIGLTFDQTNGDESIQATEYNDIINAGAGNDTITALGGNDVIFGGVGNDTINAGAGNDEITGGTGEDIIIGGAGNDTYHYNLGDGWDVVEDNDGTSGNTDTISFGAGITFADLVFTQRDSNLEITIKGDSTQGITINRFFDPSYRQNFCIEKLAFADGTIIDVPSLELTLNQTDGSETIYGSDNNDVINANGGNDIVYGYAGADVIVGGSGRDNIDAGTGNDSITGGLGDDVINGGAGNDTYYYNLGDGLDTITDNDSMVGNLDTIVFGSGITQSDLSFAQIDNDLYITVKGDETQGIKITRFFDPSYAANFRIEKLSFADGSSIDFTTTGITFNQTDTAEIINGTAFNDTINAQGGNDTIKTGDGNDIIIGGSGIDNINAGSGNDSITGGTGNDIIDGGVGDDLYSYNLGDGFDHIVDGGGSDIIKFGEGITSSDLGLFNDNGSLRITIKGNMEQGLLINKHFSNADNKIESFQFSDGTSISINSADQLIQAMSSFGVNNASSMDTNADPTSSISDMYSLAATSSINQKAI